MQYMYQQNKKIINFQEQIKINQHSDIVKTITINNDQSLIASAGFDNFIKLYDIQNNKQLDSIKSNHFQPITSIKFSKSQQQIISVSQDKFVIIYDLYNDQQPINKFRAHQGIIQDIQICENENNIVTAGADSKIKIWDLEIQKASIEIKNKSYNCINSIQVKNDLIYSGDTNTHVKIWDQKTGKQINTYKQHSDIITKLSVAQNQNLLASSSMDGTVILWDLRMDKILRILKPDNNTSIFSLDISNDGNILACGDQTDLHIFNMNSGNILHKQEIDKGYILDLNLCQNDQNGQFIIYAPRNLNSVIQQQF